MFKKEDIESIDREYFTNDTYYDDPRDNTAFERCIDVMSRLILKYGPDVLEKLNQKQMTDTHCKETDHML